MLPESPSMAVEVGHGAQVAQEDFFTFFVHFLVDAHPKPVYLSCTSLMVIYIILINIILNIFSKCQVVIFFYHC